MILWNPAVSRLGCRRRVDLEVLQSLPLGGSCGFDRAHPQLCENSLRRSISVHRHGHHPVQIVRRECVPQEPPAGFGRNPLPPRLTPQNVAERDLVRGTGPRAKFAQFHPAVNHAGIPILDRPMAEMALVEVQVNNRFSNASGLLQRSGAVPQEAVDIGIQAERCNPI